MTLALCLITLAAYSNSFRAGFTFDSRGLILEDPRIRTATAANLDLIARRTYWWPYGESGLYRPVATLSYLVNYALLGNADRPLGYHAVNLLLHMGNVLLLFALARRLIAAAWVRFFVASLWAVHPVLTESVTNIVGRPDLMAGATILGGLLIYLRSTEAQGARRWAWLAALLLVTVLGVFSKESAVALPGVILLFEATFWRERRRGRALVLGCCAMLPALLLMLYQRAAVLSALPPTAFPFWDNPLGAADFWTARLTALKVLAKYLALLVWPARLSCDYSYAQIPLVNGAPSDWLAFLVVAAIAVMTAFAWRFHRVVFFASGRGFGLCLPVSNLLFPIGSIMAERFLYLPSIVFAVSLALAVDALGRRFDARRLASFALGALVVALGARTWVRNGDWRDDVRLMTAAVEVSPRSYKSHAALAAALFESDPSHANIDRVLAEAEKSVSILEPLPDALRPPETYDRAGRYYLAKGDLVQQKGSGERGALAPEAARACRRALELLERCRAIVTANQERLVAQAVARGRLAPELDTARIAELERSISVAQLRLGDRQSAQEAAAQALDADPFSADAYEQLAAALLAQGRADDAAVTLAQGVIVTSNMDLRNELLDLYEQGLDREGCAIAARGTYDRAINPSCAIVRQHACAAIALAMRLYLRVKRRDQAEQVKAIALRDLACLPGALDGILP